MTMPTKENIIEMLETVIDPELGIDIYTLGLVYEINIKDASYIHLVMTFTTPLCPLGPVITGETEKVMRELGFKNVEIEITFDPPWKPSPDLRMMLGV